MLLEVYNRCFKGLAFVMGALLEEVAAVQLLAPKEKVERPRRQIRCQSTNDNTGENVISLQGNWLDGHCELIDNAHTW